MGRGIRDRLRKWVAVPFRVRANPELICSTMNTQLPIKKSRAGITLPYHLL